MNLRLQSPGLFITATDTEIGKTTVTCAVAELLSRQGARVGVCKPIASGCRRDREGLVSEDAEALSHFSRSRQPLEIINPVRYRQPLAPAVAAEREGEGEERKFEARNSTAATAASAAKFDIARSLRLLDRSHDVLLVEGIGGVMVPLSRKRVVLDLAREIGYPVLVVARPTLGTLNHTAMTCRLIRDAGLRLAGLVINRYHPDTRDLAESTNPSWLARQNRTTVLATIPEARGVQPHKGKLPADVLNAAGMVNWLDICGNAKAFA